MNLINHLGIGTVAATKQTNTNEIMVYLPGFAPAADGRTVATAQTVEKKSLNASGEEVASQVLTSNTFPAEWRAMGDTNRVTAPDVREGTQVSIYQVSGQNTYYWTTFGINAETMRLETVMWGYSANPALSENTPFNIDNFYTMTISTHSGFASFRTTQANGEKAAFEIKVDGMNGKVMIGGSAKNYLVKDDVAHSLTYINADGSIWCVDKKKITAYCKDSITLNADEQINLLTKNFNLQCQTIGIKAELANVDIKQTNWTGNIKQTGDYVQEGNFDQEGNITQKGNTDTTGTVTAGVDVLSLVSLNYHIHAGVQSGNATTTTPVA